MASLSCRLALMAALVTTACGTSVAAGPVCASCKGPRFSWDTVPAFIHTSNKSGPVNQGALQLMAKFPMVTVEKFQGPCGNSKGASPACDQEAQIIEVLKGVKSINPNVSTIFYYNSVLDFQQYKLHGMMLADPSLLLHNAKGEIVKMSGGGKTSDVFDFSNERTRALFIEECINATKSGFVDGCFCDRAVDGTPTDSGDDRVPCDGSNCRYKLNLTATQRQAYAAGHVQVLAELQAALGEGPLIANHASGPPHDNMVPGSVSFSMLETFGPSNSSINDLLLNTANGRGVQAHGRPTISCLAAFLIGAGYRAYFGIGGWSEGGTTFDDHWMPEFALPLGAPLSDAVYDPATFTWTRHFGRGVTVMFHAKGGNGSIVGPGWPGADPAPPPPTPVPSPTAHCPSIERAGYAHGDIKSLGTADWGACCTACGGTKGCAHWTYNPSTARGKPVRLNCHLHNANATKVVGADGRISGASKQS